MGIFSKVVFDKAFESILIQEDDLAFGSKRLLEVDTSLTVPANVVFRINITALDVLHA